MTYPLSTGEAARLLHSTEPQMAELVRRGKIRPEPRVVAGRRLWERSHLIQAARALGVLDDEAVRQSLRQEFTMSVLAALGLALLTTAALPSANDDLSLKKADVDKLVKAVRKYYAYLDQDAPGRFFPDAAQSLPSAFYITALLVVLVNLWMLARAGWDL